MNKRQRKQFMPFSHRASSACGALLLSSTTCTGFIFNSPSTKLRALISPLHVYAPPGSGYMGRNPKEDNTDPSKPNALTAEQVDQICPPNYPDSYEPMLEYPGTMRPGKTPENMPYHDLPGLGLADPDPVPWPHFQEIEWHHHWDPPEDAFPLMEDFIEMEGRWASIEEEAEMRMGMRRGVRERREMEEQNTGGDAVVIMDDDEEDDGQLDVPSMMGLGDGVDAFIGKKQETKKSSRAQLPEDDEDNDDDGDSDDFLFDLGLGDADDEEEVDTPKAKRARKSSVKASLDDDESDDADLSLDDDEDINFDLGFDLDDDEDIDLDDGGDDDGDDGDDEMFDFDDDDDGDISIDDLNAKDDGGDDDFDDGGFDYDD